MVFSDKWIVLQTVLSICLLAHVWLQMMRTWQWAGILRKQGWLGEKWSIVGEKKFNHLDFVSGDLALIRVVNLNMTIWLPLFGELELGPGPALSHMCWPGTWTEIIAIVKNQSCLWLTVRSVASIFPDFLKILKRWRPHQRHFMAHSPDWMIILSSKLLKKSSNWKLKLVQSSQVSKCLSNTVFHLQPLLQKCMCKPWNFVCNWFWIMPVVGSKLLCTAIWSCCAV